MKRTFIAANITPGEKLLKTYTKLRNELKNEKIKWVNSEDFHITLFFLGETSDEQISDIQQQLSNITNQANAFNISLSGLGVFKNINKPRVLWAGIHHYEAMKSLKHNIDEAVEKLGFEPDKKEFKPHLTLARIKWIYDKRNFENLLKEYQDEEFQLTRVNEIVFFESILKQTGPVYKPIQSFTLADSSQ